MLIVPMTKRGEEEDAQPDGERRSSGYTSMGSARASACHTLAAYVEQRTQPGDPLGYPRQLQSGIMS